MQELSSKDVVVALVVEGLPKQVCVNNNSIIGRRAADKNYYIFWAYNFAENKWEEHGKCPAVDYARAHKELLNNFPNMLIVSNDTMPEIKSFVF